MLNGSAPNYIMTLLHDLLVIPWINTQSVEWAFSYNAPQNGISSLTISKMAPPSVPSKLHSRCFSSFFLLGQPPLTNSRSHIFVCVKWLYPTLSYLLFYLCIYAVLSCLWQEMCYINTVSSSSTADQLRSETWFKVLWELRYPGLLILLQAALLCVY